MTYFCIALVRNRITNTQLQIICNFSFNEYQTPKLINGLFLMFYIATNIDGEISRYG